MSRGRGGGRGGGGRGKPGIARIAGVDIAYDDAIYVSERPQPAPLFPEHKITPPRPLTKDERSQVARFRALRDRIHDGPLYTVLGDSARVSKSSNRGSSAAAHFNAFEGMTKYSDIYSIKRRKIPNLDTRPYVLKFFPKELWSTLDPSQASNSNGVEAKPRPRKSLTAMSRGKDGLNAFDRDSPGAEPKDPTKGDGDEDEEHAEAADDEAPEEELDDEYASDEDEMAGDYNAEQYFDDGGDDAGEDYDAGDGGDEY